MRDEGAVRAAETLLRLAGRAVMLRVRQAGAGAMPPTEVTLRPCVLKVSGATAELLVAASAVEDVAGMAAELFSVSSRVVGDEIVWRVISYAAVECGAAVVAWRVQMAR